MKNKLRIIFFEISRIVMASVLLFSAIAKANDPVGVSLKVKEYLSFLPSVMSGIVEYLDMPISIALLLLEFTLGLRLILGRKPKRTVVMTFAFMIIMTVITFIIYITNGVEDCGCFGDAIHLTNGETFLKNIILLPVSLYLLLNVKFMRPVWTPEMMNISKYLLFFGFLIFLCVNYFYLPYIDFRPYSEGLNLRDEIHKQDIEQNKYLSENTKYIYRKSKVEKAFHVDSLPDEGWEFVRVDQPSKYDGLLKYDFHPIDTHDGVDMSSKILETKDPQILVLVRSLDDIDSKDDQILYSLAKDMQSKGYAQYFLFVDHKENEAGNFANLYANKLGGIGTIDNTTMYTMIRQFPSIMVIRNGVIIKKISSLDFPKLSNITTFVSQLPSSEPTKKSYLRIILLIFSLIVAFVGNIKYSLTNNIINQNK